MTHLSHVTPSPAGGTGPDRAGQFRRDLLWLFPLFSLALSGTFLLEWQQDGERHATILALPLAVAAIAASVLVARNLTGPVKARPPVRRRTVALSAVCALAPMGIMAARMPDPHSGLAPWKIGADQTVAIGYNGQLPGWSDAGDGKGGPSGFDIELAEFLKRQFGWREIKWVPILQPHRASALKEGKVQMVISNFSITDQRLEEIDMAGPYYMDVTSSQFNAAKLLRQAGEKTIGVCSTSGTTSAEAADLLTRDWSGEQVLGLQFRTRQEMSLLACEKALETNSSGPDDISMVISDWSMLKAFGSADVAPEPAFSGMSENTQLYGVGLPDGSPEVCRMITEKLRDFLDQSSGSGPWGEAFSRTLQPAGLQESWHRPTAVDPSYCGR
ncbi:transporter substrate-binding domain-containing protein [Actinoplanes rectilineatus]|uniref:transporter substrate-binding domain-containing protein n=1 Tax=Actinoplanes rectilineatus TaxID=113571 RepID=UPI0005F285DC|nr:transporter substrate-binding domain-containing protein [Actinoplanes rectilineatus]